MNRRAFRPPRRTMGADSNTDELLNHAERLGLSCALIEDRDGCPEALVGGWGGIRLAEIKTRKGKLRERQERWRKWWRGPPPSLWRTTADVERTVAELRQEAEWRRSVAFESTAADITKARLPHTEATPVLIKKTVRRCGIAACPFDGTVHPAHGRASDVFEQAKEET